MRNNNLYIVVFASISCLLFSCIKRTIPIATESPVFAFDGIIGNDSIQLIAGDSGMYMFTNYDTNIANKLTVLSGRIAKENCFTCEPYINFELYANKLQNGVPVFSLDSLIAINPAVGNVIYSYSMDSIPPVLQQKQVVFYLTDSSQQTSANWNFGDGTAGSGNPVTHIYNQPNGTFGVTLFSNSVFGMDTTIQLMKYNGSSLFFDRINVDSAVNTIVTVKGGSCACTTVYLWGDGFGDTVANGSLPITHNYGVSGKYTITKISTQNGDSSTARVKVNLPNGIVSPTFDMALQNIGGGNATPRENRNAMVITWAKDGKIYKSYKNDGFLNQSLNPILTNAKISDYPERNTAGQKTIKVEGDVDIFLYNVNNSADSIRFKSKKLVFGVARPD